MDPAIGPVIHGVPRPPWRVLFLAAPALLVLAMIYLGYGPDGFEPMRAMRALFDPSAPAADRLITLELRLPRLLLAMSSGAALALAGLLLQTYFANPMADSYVIGASTGATLGAVIAMLAAGAIGMEGRLSIPPTAFVFSLLTLVLVYRLSVRGGRVRIDYLLLTGIAVSLFSSALTSLIMIRARDPLHGVVFWLLGSLNGADRQDAALMSAALVATAIPVWRYSGPLNLLMWGDETARAMGAPVSRVRPLCLGAAALLTAMSVSLNGVITFVGLIVPHIGRFLVGTNHGLLIPASVLLGALTLTAADLASRSLLAPAEIPIGIVTALLGVPFFIVLMRRSL